VRFRVPLAFGAQRSMARFVNPMYLVGLFVWVFVSCTWHVYSNMHFKWCFLIFIMMRHKNKFFFFKLYLNIELFVNTLIFFIFFFLSKTQICVL
jgi:hypothetical protein